MNQIKLNIELIRRAFIHKREERSLYVYLHLVSKSAGKGWVDTKEFIEHMQSVTGKTQRSVYRWIRGARRMGLIVTNDRINNRLVVKGKKRFQQEWNEGKESPITTRLCMVFEEEFFKLNYKQFLSCIYSRFGEYKQSMIEYAVRTKKKESSPDSLHHDQGLNREDYNLKESKSEDKTYGCSIRLLSKFLGVPFTTIQRNTKRCKKKSRYYFVEKVDKRHMFLPWAKYPTSFFKSYPRFSFKQVGREYEIRLRLSDRWDSPFLLKV